MQIEWTICSIRRNRNMATNQQLSVESICVWDDTSANGEILFTENVNRQCMCVTSITWVSPPTFVKQSYCMICSPACLYKKAKRTSEDTGRLSEQSIIALWVALLICYVDKQRVSGVCKYTSVKYIWIHVPRPQRPSDFQCFLLPDCPP